MKSHCFPDRTHKTSATFLNTTLVAVALLAGAAASAQSPSLKLADRLTGPIDNATRATLSGSASPRALHATDLGAVSPSTPLTGIRLVFSRSAAQQTALTQLLAAQQDTSSPQFHQWLTPAQFGARFGVSDNDLAATESWLQSQGFTVVSVSPSRESILVSGTESSVESAFGTPLHYFKSTAGSFNGSADIRTHIAPAHDLTLPAALSPLVLAVNNLSDYRPHSNAIKRPAADFTSSVSGNHYLTPKDVAVIYDINPAYNAGYTGSGQTIVVAGQSEVLLSDIANFQAAAGVATNAPNPILVPNTGSAVISSGDEAESDLDLEYTSSIASKATIDFIYTGSNLNYGVFDSVVYAIQNGLGQIITISYSECEPDLGASYFAEYELYFQQAAAAGQTVMSSSGDSGSTSCYGDGTSTANQEQVAVGYPASSDYVTGIGGTEFPAADVAASNSTYFQSTPVTGTSSNDIVASALSYIPEQAWNDDSSTYGLSSGGGGVSIYATRPSWQTGVPGITAGSYRLVPDVSLDSSPNNAGYLYCSSDNGTYGVGFSGSCTSGFRVAGGTTLTVAGGTSFASPIFAGMVAIINQAKGYNAGSGLINPTLYTLASNATTYASAFHDIISGGNQCLAGSSYCSGASVNDYPTTTGYDLATGLGSVDLYKLIAAWPKSTSSLVSSTTTATPATTSPALSTPDLITIQVSGKNGTPTGTVAITDNGTAVTNSPFTLNASGAYTYAYSSAVAGIHTIVVTYSGNSIYASSKATFTLNVGNIGFTITGTNVTVTSGNTVTENLTFTSTNGYSGTVDLTTFNGPLVNNACFTIPATSLTLAANQTVVLPFTIYTNPSNCPSGAYALFQRTRYTSALDIPAKPGPASPWRSAPVPPMLAGLLLVGCLKRRSRLLRGGLALGLVFALGLSGLGLAGCSNQSAPATNTTTTTTTTTAPTGTYSFSLSASDSVNTAISATSNTFTITIQ